MTVWGSDPFWNSLRILPAEPPLWEWQEKLPEHEPDVVQESAPTALFLQRVRQIFHICCSFLQILMLQYQLAQ